MKIGDIQEIKGPTLKASAKGGFGRSDKDVSPGHLDAFPGYCFFDYDIVIEEIKSACHHKTKFEVTYDPAHIKTEEFERLLIQIDGEGRGMLVEAYGEGNFEGELDQIKTKIRTHMNMPQRLSVNAVAEANARGEDCNEVYIGGHVKAKMMYIGKDMNDVIATIKAMKEGTPEISPEHLVTSRVSFEQIQI